MTPRGHVLLAVSGGIAAYKAVEVMRGFQKAGLEVRACMTANAARFVGPLTFAAISGHAVPSGGLGAETDAAMAHVAVTRDACLFVVAPATANIIAKLASGLADDWPTTHALACEAPLLVAPAMNHRMWSHPAVVANLGILRARGAVIVPPESGDLACREVGEGRMAAPELIVAEGLRLIEQAVSRVGDLAGLEVLVTSGPTHEAIDDVRFVGNRSSGRMGHALAAAAAARGARVILVSGPVGLPDPPGCDVERVTSADEMASAVARRLGSADLAFFAAAVADYQPVRTAGKIRRAGSETLALELHRTRDVLGESVAARPHGLLVGFAAEVGDAWRDSARAKHSRKGCDLLVGNRVDGATSAFDSDENEACVFGPDGAETLLARAPKPTVAHRLLDLALAAHRARGAR